MVSFRSRELRIHEGYLGAPREVLKAIVMFVEGRTSLQRRAARRVLLGYPIVRTSTPAERRRDRPDPRDERSATELMEWHRTLNAGYFEGTLRAIEVSVSRRMRSRLGHYTAASAAGEPAEIVISRRHIRRHGREEALNTLLHEMIHQWQQEITGQEEDSYHGHGPAFRNKANEIGRMLDLAPVRTSKKRGPDKLLPSCASWPHCVRPADYYLGAYMGDVLTDGDTDAEGEPEPAVDPTATIVETLVAMSNEALNIRW